MNIKVKGFSPDILVSIITCVTQNYLDFNMKNRDDESKHLLLEQSECRAYSVTPEKALVHNLLWILPCIHNEIWGIRLTDEDALKLIDKFITVFSNTNTDPFRRSNFPIFIKQEKTVIIDLLHILRVLTYWSDDISISQKGAIGSNRGQRFQEEIRRMIRDNNFEKSVIVFPESSENLYRNGICVAEIDIGVLVDDVYFVIECKYKLKGRGDIAGEDIVEKRNWEKQKEWLAQVDSTADAILDGATFSDERPALPLKAKFVVPIVCTCEPMYMFEEKEYYFLTKSIPRVLAPAELSQIIASSHTDYFNTREVIKKALCTEGTV